MRSVADTTSCGEGERPEGIDKNSPLSILPVNIEQYDYLQIAENFDMPFFEVSCKSNINIEDAFLTLAREIREQREAKGVNGEEDEKPKERRLQLSGNALVPFALGSTNGENGRCSC